MWAILSAASLWCTAWNKKAQTWQSGKHSCCEENKAPVNFFSPPSLYYYFICWFWGNEQEAVCLIIICLLHETKDKADSKYTVEYSIQHMWIYYYLSFYSDLQNFHNSWLTIICLQKLKKILATKAHSETLSNGSYTADWVWIWLVTFPDSQSFVAISILKNLKHLLQLKKVYKCSRVHIAYLIVYLNVHFPYFYIKIHVMHTRS